MTSTFVEWRALPFDKLRARAMIGNTPPPAVPNPYAVNLNENIQRLKLNVRQFAPGHGPGVATMADLRAAIGQGVRSTN